MRLLSVQLYCSAPVILLVWLSLLPAATEAGVRHRRITRSLAGACALAMVLLGARALSALHDTRDLHYRIWKGGAWHELSAGDAPTVSHCELGP